MTCSHCQSNEITKLQRKTKLAYACYRCKACHRLFNERTGTPFNHLQFPTDVVMLVLLWRLRYPLSLRNLVEMFLGFWQDWFKQG